MDEVVSSEDQKVTHGGVPGVDISGSGENLV